MSLYVLHPAFGLHIVNPGTCHQAADWYNSGRICSQYYKTIIDLMLAGF